MSETTGDNLKFNGTPLTGRGSGYKPFTKETASEMGKKGGIASAEARRRPHTIAELREQGPHALAELLDAAYGRGDWKKLDLKERIGCLKAAIPYLLGRPPTMRTDDANEDLANDEFSVTTRPANAEEARQATPLPKLSR